MLSCAVSGLYIWEFFTHLDYEWNVIKGHRPYRWTIWIYSTVRLAALVAVIINLVTFVMVTTINCQVWTIFQYTFGYMTFSSSSLLIILRMYRAGFSGIIHPQIRGEGGPHSVACGLPAIRKNKSAIIAMLVADIALLLIMLIGLLRIRHSGGGRFDLGRLLWKQGVIYLLVATIAEITPVVSICLDLNGDLLFLWLDMSENMIFTILMFLMPSLITMSIAATRMHRSLADFIFSADIGNGVDNLPKDGRVPITKRISTISLSSNQMEVALYTSHEHSRSLAPQTGQRVPYVSSNVQLGDKLKPHGLNSDDDMESSAE
ncbi:hypothetical protein BC827DRAFT_1153903 [Russula dissimulans]|nr:hypothetical protein BC827DRAFT_1153903 [Russula dissimulans]